MATTTTLILGGGTAGLSTASHLRQRLGKEHRVIVAERRSTFVVGATNTWVMLDRMTVRQARHSRASISARGIELRQGDVQEIDPDRRRARIDGDTIDCDYLVVALGAELEMTAVPGLADAAGTFYSLQGAERLRDELNGNTWRRLVVLIPRAPFQCPAAPYEAALLLAEQASRRAPGGRSAVSLYTVEPAPMVTAGPLAGELMTGVLARQGVEAHFLMRTSEVDPGHKRVRFDDGSDVGYDLLIAVPPHSAPHVVREAGLVDAGGWVRVDSETLEVSGHPNVFALGDVTSIPLPGRFKPEMPLMLPKAGVFAEAHGRVVASAIASRIAGGSSPTRFDGKGYCYIETGQGRALRGDGSFFAHPHPSMEFTAADSTHLEEKERWVSELVSTCLG